MVEIQCDFGIDFVYFGCFFGHCFYLVVQAVETQEDDEASLFIRFRFAFQHGDDGQEIGLSSSDYPLFVIRYTGVSTRLSSSNQDMYHTKLVNNWS
jgi:hypothetical protein